MVLMVCLQRKREGFSKKRCAPHCTPKGTSVLAAIDSMVDRSFITVNKWTYLVMVLITDEVESGVLSLVYVVPTIESNSESV